jgi:hypothetical protein
VYRSFNALVAQLSKVEAAIEQLDPSCARLLAALPAVSPDHGTAIAERIAYAGPRCEIVTSCATGKQRLATQLRAAGKSDEAIAQELADADTQLCPIDAPGTAVAREARVQHRVMMANARLQPCAAIVDAAEAAGISPPLFALHAAKCLARAGQCERAKTYIASEAQRAALASQFPGCRL